MSKNYFSNISSCGGPVLGSDIDKALNDLVDYVNKVEADINVMLDSYDRKTSNKYDKSGKNSYVLFGQSHCDKTQVLKAKMEVNYSDLSSSVQSGALICRNGRCYVDTDLYDNFKNKKEDEIVTFVDNSSNANRNRYVIRNKLLPCYNKRVFDRIGDLNRHIYKEEISESFVRDIEELYYKKTKKDTRLHIRTLNEIELLPSTLDLSNEKLEEIIKDVYVPDRQIAPFSYELEPGEMEVPFDVVRKIYAERLTSENKDVLDFDMLFKIDFPLFKRFSTEYETNFNSEIQPVLSKDEYVFKGTFPISGKRFYVDSCTFNQDITPVGNISPSRYFICEYQDEDDIAVTVAIDLGPIGKEALSKNLRNWLQLPSDGHGDLKWH